MRLAEFITTNTEPIVAEWVAFAATCGPAGQAMGTTALRDHAVALLNTITIDLQTRQTEFEQSEKAKGNAAPAATGLYTAAEIHGAGRAEGGFTLGEMVSEFRALRASILRLWMKATGSLTGGDLDDLIRFNEAIDQATAESISRFATDLDYSMQMFIAILAHDLRSPLNAVVMSSQFMLERGALEQTDVNLANGTLRSALRMNSLVGDLLDFTRSRLGSSIPIERGAMDIGVVARHAVDEAAAANPKCTFNVATDGDLLGEWDSGRIGQLLANLLANAIQHGLPGGLITLTVRGEATDVVLTVHNRGAPIPVADIPRIFDPVKRLRSGQASAPNSSNLGLGLYIAERIASAHEGAIHVESSERRGTAFVVRLPRGHR